MYERQLDEGWDIEGLSPGFTGYKKLKEKAHPYALDAVNQETRTHSSSTSIQHSTQNVKQGSENTSSTSGLYLLSWTCFT